MRAMTRLARRWCRILGIDPDAAPPAPVEIGLSDLLDAIRDAIEEIEAAVRGRLHPAAALPARRSREARAREGRAQAAPTRPPARSSAARPRPARSPAPATPATARPPPPAASPAPCATPPPAGATRSPSPRRSRPAGSACGKALAAAAQRAAGAVPTAEPFTRTRSRRVPAPPLRVGIACDISGSMSAFTGPVASAAWILARAAALPALRRPPPPSCSASSVHALTRPGEAPARVTDFGAPDGTERLCRAIDALDGELGLSRPGTARLLVIVSDTYLRRRGETAGGQQRITRLARAGCGVIILRPKTATPARPRWTDCQVTDARRPRRHHRRDRPRRHPRPHRLNPRPGRGAAAPPGSPPGRKETTRERRPHHLRPAQPAHRRPRPARRPRHRERRPGSQRRRAAPSARPPR